jgi:hypothetical protein
MTKRLVDIDDAILEEVRTALGTTTLKDTVNGSLHATAQAYRRSKITKEDIARFAELAKDLGDPEVMAKVWE